MNIKTYLKAAREYCKRNITHELCSNECKFAKICSLMWSTPDSLTDNEIDRLQLEWDNIKFDS